MSTALVVGGTGFIGGAVARALRREGWAVYATTRKESGIKDLQKDEIIPVHAAELSKETIGDIINKCAVVIDCTGGDIVYPIVEQVVKDRKAFPAIHFIFISGLLGKGHSEIVRDEASPDTPSADMMKGRVEKEKRYLTSDPVGLPTIVLRPGWVYGGNSGSFISSWWGDPKGPIKCVPNTYYNWVHVEDLAESVVLTAKKRFEVKGELIDIGATGPLRYEDVRAAMAKAGGYTGELKFIPLDDSDKGGWNEAMFVSVKLRCQKARDVLGWIPKHIGFLDELDIYYNAYLGHKK
eukprot:TRINITY_DN16008_c0_g1_i1.p1 TRINITY_DN16008_c0_g1~~TRINITY_DN16008_c0_g1_i1.p1  ORF type:complete len:294 (-),score=56.76 TRINITY_DN16008_c0_g1_i1:37-918(-)